MGSWSNLQRIERHMFRLDFVLIFVSYLFFPIVCFSRDIHPASRGGPPTPQVFWFGPCKDIEHASTIFLQCFLIVFLQHPRNLYNFGHKVGPKHRFLQCCFNFFFKNNIIYAFFNIKLVQNIGFCSVFNILTSQIL